MGAVERLDLAILVNGPDDGVGGRIDVKPNEIAQFADKIRVVRELELPLAVRLQAMGTPDAPDRAFTDAGRRGNHRGRPMGRLDGRVRQRQHHHAFGHFGPQGWDARRARFVTEKAIDAFLHEPLLPAPDAGLRCARPAHDLVRSDAVRAQKNDCRLPHMLLGGIALPDHSFKTKAVGRADCDGNSAAHTPDSQMRPALGIPKRTLPLGGDH